MKKGKLILINGASSAGKTSLCRAFQDHAQEMWVRLGIDHFWFIMPPNKLILNQQDAEYFILRWSYL
ncbi:Chloramphenicol phosphotransferase-like protein [Legionella gratiana]|uniref:Chloramphenicol phosphotransferase-like protein n=1 Tax=Legionella gratiana TaxID=45066 RepID=A0A378JDH4_9GAMM|nr:zeta toxin family protein [Legionella gratiana]KTD15641.1 Chloramphenicol phosphotransferase-like protein [Legionella gratiana]STX44917.1 Chloramphenicol phosphotransferase-like protein [Legionella gratiana]